MGHIAKAGREGDINDREMQVVRVGQHCKRALKPAFHKALGERLSRLLEQSLDVSPRQAQCADDVVEIEIGVLRGQCLDRRIGTRQRLESEIAAWERLRNAARSRIKWMFTIEKARTKMGRTYPCQSDPRHSKIKES